jgi:hypothetical protein
MLLNLIFVRYLIIPYFQKKLHSFKCDLQTIARLFIDIRRNKKNSNYFIIYKYKNGLV